jgi:uncharacterized protein
VGDDGLAETIDALGPVHLRQLVARTRDAFAAHRDEIDALNVFPVPDGDTGTNLYLTARSAAEDSGDDPDPTSLARGALLGARGNSGVIFSQVLRAFAETIEERGDLDPPALAAALERAKRHAYEAVANPVEGTMLTTIRAAADAADETAGAGLADALRHVCTAVNEALARTPEQLDVLREAGVVDAGGRGFEVFCQELHSLVSGEPPPERQAPPPVVHRSAPVAARESGSLEYRFEVQYLLAADDRAAAPLRERLGLIGDSVVVVSGGDVLNVHVHTNDIGAAIEEGLEFGRPSRIQVTSFEDQIDGPDHTPEATGDAALGCVAVLPGSGLRELAESVGAAAIQAGGGDLPAVADLLAAVRDVGDALGLGADWFNVGPAGLVDFGLPPGLEDRVTVRQYDGLEVHLPGREDIVCFKLYAAVDQTERSKHFIDLRALRPSHEELLRAAMWTRTHDPSPGFRTELRRILALLGLEVGDHDL